MTQNTLYALSFLVMLALTYSYGFAFFLTKKTHIFALAFFMFAMTLRTFGIVWQLYSKEFTGTISTLPFSESRALLVLVSATFLLYTTWKKNNIK